MPQKHFTILVTGSTGSGKTSLLQRFKANTFSETYNPTEWMQRGSHTVTVDGEEIRLVINDADGRKQYESHSINYYTTMDAIIIIYDISSQKSVESIEEICQLIKKYCKQEMKKPCAVIVGNKSDLQREVNRIDMENFAKKEDMPHIETSAKTGENVEAVFMSIIKRLAGSSQITITSNNGGSSGSPPTITTSNNGCSSGSPPTITTSNNGCSCVII